MNVKEKRNIIKTFGLLKYSYSPYSNFRVACSIILKDNTYIGGVNVENKSYGLTICAERNAMTSLISQKYDYKNIVSQEKISEEMIKYTDKIFYNNGIYDKLYIRREKKYFYFAFFLNTLIRYHQDRVETYLFQICSILIHCDW